MHASFFSKVTAWRAEREARRRRLGDLWVRPLWVWALVVVAPVMMFAGVHGLPGARLVGMAAVWVVAVRCCVADLREERCRRRDIAPPL